MLVNCIETPPHFEINQSFLWSRENIGDDAVSSGKGRDSVRCIILTSVPGFLQMNRPPGRHSWGLPQGYIPTYPYGTMAVLSQGRFAEFIEKLQGSLWAKIFTHGTGTRNFRESFIPRPTHSLPFAKEFHFSLFTCMLCSPSGETWLSMTIPNPLKLPDTGRLFLEIGQQTLFQENSWISHQKPFG